MDAETYIRPVSSASLASLSSSSSTTDETDELKDALLAKQSNSNINVNGSEIFTTNISLMSPGKDWSQDVADAYEQEQELDRSYIEEDDEYVTAPFDIPYDSTARTDIFPTYYEEDSPELYYHPDQSVLIDVAAFEEEDGDIMAPPTSHLLTHVAFLARQNEFLRAELSHARENIHAMRRVVETMDMERIAEREKLVERAEQERIKRNEWIADIFKNGSVCTKCAKPIEGLDKSPSIRPPFPEFSPYHSPLERKTSQEYVAGWTEDLEWMEENSKHRSRNYDDFDTPAVPYNSDAEEVYQDDDAISDLDIGSEAASPTPREGGLARMLWRAANEDSDSDANDEDDEPAFTFRSRRSSEDARIRLTPCHDGEDDENIVVFPKKVFSFSTWGGEGDDIYAGSSDEGSSINDETCAGDSFCIEEEELEVY